MKYQVKPINRDNVITHFWSEQLNKYCLHTASYNLVRKQSTRLFDLKLARKIRMMILHSTTYSSVWENPQIITLD